MGVALFMFSVACLNDLDCEACGRAQLRPQDVESVRADCDCLIVVGGGGGGQHATAYGTASVGDDTLVSVAENTLAVKDVWFGVNALVSIRMRRRGLRSRT